MLEVNNIEGYYGSLDDLPTFDEVREMAKRQDKEDFLYQQLKNEFNNILNSI